MVKIKTLPGGDEKEVSFEEAQELLEETYTKPGGGFVVDAQTGGVLYQLDPDISDIIIVEEMLGGG
jgi:hypothetical protein